MRYYRILIVLVLVSGLFGCQTPGKQPPVVQQAPLPEIFTSDSLPAAKPWTDKGFQNDPNHFQFAIISDLHGGNIPGIFEEAVKRINLMQPEFVVSVGDLIEGYSEEETEIDHQREAFEKGIAPLDMRFFYLPGNHDLTNLTLAKKWRERFGPSYYHFVYRNVLFLCLNTEEPPPSQMSDAQIGYIREVLAQHPDVRWTIAIMHKPMWTENSLVWEKIEPLLAGRPHTVFAGHFHIYNKSERNGKKYIRLSVTGGGNPLRGPAYGEFNQIAWVTMTEAGPKIANLDLNGILDEDLSTEPLAMIEALSKNSWFTADAIVSKSKKFKKGRSVLNFSNPGALPLTVKWTVKPHPQLTVSEQNIDLTLPPRSNRKVPLEVIAKKPLLLADLQPLLCEISAVYNPPQGSPMKSEATQALDIHYNWQGPELIQNGSFSSGMENWITRKKTPTSAELKVEQEGVKIRVFQKDMIYAMVLVQQVGELKKDTDYQLVLKAKSLHGPDKIGVSIRDGNDYTPMLIDGKTEPRHMISLTESMKRHEINFRIAKETDVASGLMVFSFLTENEVVIDSVSLRPVNKNLTAQK
ncbi:MAG: hypothetical protein FP816_15995 [Desulfobacteraceae bacterium]|nr:hypothetical protein [Desulfobacteraceae bacterium]MBU4052851.1 metallophosphoesterase [Pseudomonadota bacterium]